MPTKSLSSSASGQPCTRAQHAPPHLARSSVWGRALKRLGLRLLVPRAAAEQRSDRRGRTPLPCHGSLSRPRPARSAPWPLRRDPAAGPRRLFRACRKYSYEGGRGFGGANGANLGRQRNPPAHAQRIRGLRRLLGSYSTTASQSSLRPGSTSASRRQRRRRGGVDGRAGGLL